MTRKERRAADEMECGKADDPLHLERYENAYDDDVAFAEKMLVMGFILHETNAAHKGSEGQ